MFKIKHIFFLIIFALLSACEGVGSSSSSSSSSIDHFVEELTPFHSTWRVEEDDSKSITLPLVEDYNYNFTVDWGDGQTSTITSYDDPDRIHTYEVAGDYNLVIEGLLEAWSFNDAGDKDKILSVEDFGNLGYKNLSGAFHGCTNLSTFEGRVTSSVTDMSNMFNSATQANPDVGNWDVSQTTDMTGMFDNSGFSTANYDALLINFANNTSVNSVTLGVSNIQYSSDAAKTAKDTLVFDRDWIITDGGDATPSPFRSTWRVGESDKTITLPLVDVDGDYKYKYNFTVDWGDGQTSTITSYDNPDKKHTYENVGDYSLVIEGLLEAWSFGGARDGFKILSVEDFGDLGYKNLSGAFESCENLTTFEGGVTSSVTNMAHMFQLAINANPNVRTWDVSKVTNMVHMFQNIELANPDVSKWNVSSVTDMSDMFFGALVANPDVSKWNVSSVTNMGSMFEGAPSANPDVSKWNVSSVTDMSDMFFGALVANPDVSKWNVSSSVEDMFGMFDDSGLSTGNYNAFLINLANNNPLVMNVELGASGIQYSSDAAKAARNTLESRGWTIDDGGMLILKSFDQLFRSF